MKKAVFSGLVIFLALTILSSMAYPWNFATHAYVATKIGKVLGNANEMYGIMLPDLFNFDFSLMDDMVLRGYTHGIPGTPPNENFMSVWYNASWGLKKSLAFGYVAHNDAWGMDFVAHWQANPAIPQGDIPFPIGVPNPTYQPPGYVIQLAATLDFALAMNSVWAALGIENDYASRLMFCHNIIEYAGDLVVKRADPLIGSRLITAAFFRTPEAAKLLQAAFPPFYKTMIAAAEPKYRDFLIQYGLILLTPEKTAINLLANQLADLAIDYFQYINPLAPPGYFDAYKPQLIEFGKMSLAASIQICEAANYMDEVNKLVVPYITQQLVLHGVTY
jgi:hypothetical protein